MNLKHFLRGLLAVVWLAPVLAAGGPLAQFRSALGDIEVELLEQDKPATVANFMRYVESGWWADMFAHRLDPGFVLQGGGYHVVGREGTNAAILRIAHFETVPNEFAVGRRFSNGFGTLAMAKVGGDTNSASAEWFFNLADNGFLDAEDRDHLFTVFGRVVRGTNVLNVLNGFAYYTGANSRPTNVVANIGAPLGELPLLRTNATFADLLYFDITLLGVDVARGAGGAVIGWNSVGERTNRVEFTRTLPPVWEVLVRTNGSGGRMVVEDAVSQEDVRFYRVRVEY